MEIKNNHYIVDNKEYIRTTALPKYFALRNSKGYINPIVKEFWTELHQKKGTALHKYAELRDSNDANDIKFDKSIAGRVNSYEMFLKNYLNHHKTIFCEKFLKSDKHSFAGTIDRLIDKDGEIELIDLKSSLFIKSVCCQMGAYSLLLIENGYIKSIKKLSVKVVVIGDEGYKIYPIETHDVITGAEIFKSMLNVYRYWK